MRNWIIVLLIFVIPLGLYAFFEARRGSHESIAKTMQNKPVVYKFMSPMCSECKEVDKKLQNIKDDWELVIFEEVNVAGGTGKDKQAKELIRKYDITTVPTLVFVDNAGNLYRKIEVDMTDQDIINGLKGIAPQRKK